MGDEYDFDKLSDYMVELKREYPDTTDASVLLEPQISYDYLIRAMDVVRSADIKDQTPEGFTRVALFQDIAVGEAP